MKIAIVGPIHPYKGGIAQHTTELAHHLKSSGHDVEIISWRRLYPFFYPGDQFVPENKPEIEVFAKSRRELSWNNPLGWWRQASKLKSFDKVIFVWWVPKIQGPIYFSMMHALKKSKVEKILLCHNILQHSSGASDKTITRKVFRLADRLIVHTKLMADQASKLSNTAVTMVSMPPHFPTKPSSVSNSELSHRLLFFGMVRHYKGVDILLRALAQVPNIKLLVAGEMWGKQQAKLEQLIDELKLGDRVELLPSYVPSDKIGEIFSAADALVMPYRSGTASQTYQLAFAYGLPVIATRVGSQSSQIRDGVDGLLCEPNDSSGLSATIASFYEPGVAKSLRLNVHAIDSETPWRQYIDAIVNS